MKLSNIFNANPCYIRKDEYVSIGESKKNKQFFNELGRRIKEPKRSIATIAAEENWDETITQKEE